MEIGESVAVNVLMDERLPCGFCGEHHDAHRKEPVELKTIAGSKPAWKRRSMQESEARPVSGLYPDGVRAEVHHCIALSAFCIGLGRKSGSPKDFIPRLNHWLDKGAYSPNDPPNCASLPGRKKKGEDSSYGQFFAAVRAGRPLQMHIGNHEAPFFAASQGLLVQIARIFSEGSNLCETMDQEDVQRKLMDLIARAENLAFRKTVTYEAPFRLHHKRLMEACREFLASPENRQIGGKSYEAGSGVELARDILAAHESTRRRMDFGPTSPFERRS
ncbi:MAG: hypothetical protein IPN17_23880 [Deltaproteobacteria bacterium]|nr:hypothetical protein [Deltaproteobacteria bacterium]MBK8695229.1 hypothetical protein [Deltaproteobacteria bacterium]MBP6831507.1 hypothetical protein [Deltaproteobacteria bacterium]